MDFEEFPILYTDPEAQELAWQMSEEIPEIRALVESMSRHPSVIEQPQLAIYSLLRILEIHKKN